MTAPSIEKITSYNPPKRILMGAGPSNMHARVLNAMSRNIVGHMDPSFAGMMEEMKVLMRYAFQTKNALTYPASGPGSVGMETCFVNLVSRGDKVIVCRNGVFGGRMIENVERCGGTPIIVEDTWGEPVDPNKVEDALKKNPDAKVVAFVHAETSTGCCSDAKTIAAIAHKYDAVVIADTVTSLGGNPVLVDEWGLDAVYSGSQKCVSCAPGLSPLTFSDRVVEKIKNRKEKVESWFMDVNFILNYWMNTARTYHHTAPINALYGLHEALLMIYEEGIENAWARHEQNHIALKAGLEVLGMEFIVKEGYRLPQINTVKIPEGVNDAAVRNALLEKYQLEIGSGLGPLAGKVWRFGLLGQSSQQENVLLCMAAMEDVLSSQGYKVNKGEAVAATHRAYAKLHEEAAQKALKK